MLSVHHSLAVVSAMATRAGSREIVRADVAWPISISDLFPGASLPLRAGADAGELRVGPSSPCATARARPSPARG
jgi:hypothetical protein